MTDTPQRTGGKFKGGLAYYPDREFEEALKGKPNPVKIDLADPRVRVNMKLYEARIQYRKTAHGLRRMLEHRVTHYPRKEDLVTRLNEAWRLTTGRLLRTGAIRNLKEADAFTDGDPADSLLRVGTGTEFLPLIQGPFSRQLYLFDFLDQHRKAFEAWNHNPVAKQIVKITTRFALGRGVRATAPNPKVQAVWDRFDEKNHLTETKLGVMSDDASIFGELMLRYFDRPFSDYLLLRELDPATVWEIVTDPDDIDTVYYYHQQYQTAFQIYGTAETKLAEYIIRQVPAEEVDHFRMNVVTGEKRGRSDLYPILGWLKRLKDFYTDRVIRNKIATAFVMDHLIKGSEEDVQKIATAQGATFPEPGSSFFHNESEELKVIAAEIKSSDARDDGEAILNLIAVGSGVPKEYLGISAGGSRATALVASEPGAKKFQDHQQLLERVLMRMSKRVLAHAKRKGLLDGVPDDEMFLEFTFPEIVVEDRAQKLKDLALSEIMKWIAPETAAVTAAKELNITNYNFDQEQEKVQAQLSLIPATPPPGVLPSGLGKNGLPQKGAASGLSGQERTQTRQDLDTQP